MGLVQISNMYLAFLHCANLDQLFLVWNHHRSGGHLTDPIIYLKDRLLSCAAGVFGSDENLLVSLGVMKTC